MLVMTQQHGIDGANLGDGHGRLLGFRERDVRQPILAGHVEGGVGDKAVAVHLDQGGWTADQGDLHTVHTPLLSDRRNRPCPRLLGIRA